MRKIIGLLLLVLTFATMLTACGEFECELCEKEKSGKKHTVEFFGETAEICDDCYENIQELEDALQEIKDAFN